MKITKGTYTWNDFGKYWADLMEKPDNLHEEILMLIRCIDEDLKWGDSSIDPDYWRGRL